MRVLIAEDDPICRVALETKLASWGYRTVSCDNGSEALRLLLAPNAPALAILDWLMPGLSGLEVCREIRKRPPEPYRYLLMLTVKDKPQDIVAALETGADDYVTKPFDFDELKARLLAGQRILQVQQALVASRDALRIKASHDALTGLWNRGAILQVLKRELDRARRGDGPVGIALGDVDAFKQINDTYGHLAGDIALRQVADALRRHVRSYDMVGRYGGEEFLIVLPGADLSNTRMIAERIRAFVESLSITLDLGANRRETVRVTMSFGLAVSAQPRPCSDPDALIREADGALYQAKKRHGNRVELIEADEGQEASGRV